MSLTELIKKYFKTLFFRYLPREFFALGILDASFEAKCLFAIIFLSRNMEFMDVLTLDFSVTTDFI